MWLRIRLLRLIFFSYETKESLVYIRSETLKNICMSECVARSLEVTVYSKYVDVKYAPHPCVYVGSIPVCDYGYNYSKTKR